MPSVKTGGIRSAVGVPDEKLHGVINDWQRVITLGFKDDCRSVVQMVDEVRELRIYERMGYVSEAEFYADVMMLEPGYVVVAYKFLKENGGQQVGWDEIPDIRDKPGRPEKAINGSNTTIKDRGLTYQLARLKRDNPELAQQVIDGKLSANAAAIQAGFRRPMKSIPIDTPANAITALLRVFDLQQLSEEIQSRTTTPPDGNRGRYEHISRGTQKCNTSITETGTPHGQRQ